MLNRWQRRRLYPPPPPTPEGMCWRVVYDGQGRQITGLVAATEVQAQAATKMELYDSLDRGERDWFKQDTLRKRERARMPVLGQPASERRDLYIKEISVRANHVLRNGIGKYDPSPDEVWRKGRDYWLHRPNCGRKTVNEITAWLATHKLLWDEGHGAVKKTPRAGRRARGLTHDR
jgi:hypothetical protein